jgi:hypothetical protein
MKCTFQLVVLLIFSLSCSEDPITDTCADPIGTDEYSMSVKSYSCYQKDIKSCFRFDLTNGVPLIQSLYSVTPADAPLFKDMGESSCLSQVKEKPSSGWSYVVEIKLHHGYSMKLADGTYGRLFIHSWEKGATVTKVNLTRQYSY